MLGLKLNHVSKRGHRSWWYNRNNAHYPDSKVHGANMGPTWVLSAPDRPHVGPMNLAIKDLMHNKTAYMLLEVFCTWNIMPNSPTYARYFRSPKSRHDMDTLSIPLALCGGNLSITVGTCLCAGNPNIISVFQRKAPLYYFICWWLEQSLNKQSGDRWKEAP